MFDNLLNTSNALISEYALTIIWAVVILIVGRIVAGWIRKIIEKLMHRGSFDITVSKFIGNLVYGIALAFVIIMALSKLGVETTSVIAIFGAAGLAIGLALQNSLSNFAAGIMMLIFRQIRVGDFVEAGGVSGTVQEIKIFSTTLKTGDNKVLFVPNSKISGDTITNYSIEKTRRVDMTFGIGYPDSTTKAKEVILKVLSMDDRILTEPAPQIVVSSLGDSSVNLFVRPWVKKEDYWGVYFDITEKVKLAFDEAGISIPFPQTDVNLYHK